ncbi:retroviral-like aspartic protease 1 [Rhizophagus irregularis DAOM 181602=DAOM 197198]|nr:retroviral-like aspartic protease 1 [Rhizophagus irregularis DAOM 181602=DAOM 197198]
MAELTKLVTVLAQQVSEIEKKIDNRPSGSYQKPPAARPELSVPDRPPIVCYSLPAQRNRPKTRSTPYPNKEIIEEENAREDPQYAPIPIPIQTTNNVGEGEPMTVDAKEQATEIKKKKATVWKKKTLKVQPSIAAHIPLYNIVADLQQQRANITFGQLFQISPKLRNDVGKSLRKPMTRSAKFAHQDVQSTTAMYCDAMIKGKRIPLIVDTGAAGSIVTCQLLNDLGIAIDRPSAIVMINVNGEKKRPLGEVLDFLITFGGVTVPINVVVIDTESYSAIEEVRIVESEEEEDDDDGDEEEESDDEYEEEELEEKVYCCYQFESDSTDTLKQRRSSELKKENSTTSGDLVLINQGFYLQRNFYHWNYYRYLDGKFQSEKARKEICGNEGKSLCLCGKARGCKTCRNDFTLYTAVKNVPEQIVTTMSIVTPEENEPPTKEQRSRDLESARNRKDKERSVALPFLHNEITDIFARESKLPNVGELTETQRNEFQKLIEQYQDLFAWTTAELAEEIQKMLKQELIEKSKSAWASPVVLVQKKNGKMRFCVDYRQLNQVTKKDSYPLPRIDDMLDALGHVSWYTSLDLASGYWQVEVNSKDREKTAFITQYGTYQFLDFVVVYLDDLNVYSTMFEKHLEHLRNVFDRLKNAGLKLNPEKCYFVKRELLFLGYVISSKGIRTDPTKIKKVENFPIPRNVTQLRGFLGLASYYRRFIKDFSKIANPLNKLLRKDSPFFDEEFILLTDASTLGLGAILAQKDEDEFERVIAYASRTLSKAERNYSATELECLAVVWAVGHFHPYVHGKRFTLITDHSALCYLFNSATPTGRLAAGS